MERGRIMNSTIEITAQHVARVQAVMEEHNIKDGSRIFNIDETGISFKHLLTHCNQQGIVETANTGTTMLSQTRGALDHVKLMPVVSADGNAYNLLFCFSISKRTISGCRRKL